MTKLYTALLAASAIALASVAGCKSKEESKLERTVAVRYEASVLPDVRPEPREKIKLNTTFNQVWVKYKGDSDISSAMKKFEKQEGEYGYATTFTGVANLYESLSRFNFDVKTKEKIDLVVLAGLHSHMSSFNILMYLRLLQVPEYHQVLIHEKMLDVIENVSSRDGLENLTKTKPISSLGKINTFMDYLELKRNFSKVEYFDGEKGWIHYMEILERNPELRSFLTEERTMRNLVKLDHTDDRDSRHFLADCGDSPTFDDVTERYLKLLIEDKESRPLLTNISVLDGLANVYTRLKEKEGSSKDERVAILEKGLGGYGKNAQRVIKKCLCWHGDPADHF